MRDGLKTLLGRWERQAAMSRFTPAAVHGDATTSNFVFPSSDEVVAIDWERLWVTDPAFDLGRLMAEISHSITRWGGNESEAQYYAQLLASAYGGALPPGADAGALVSRATFYHASSALRIARNGWVSRLDRMGLVAQAMALLARLDD